MPGTLDIVRLEQDLHAAALDADRYAVDVADMLTQQLPSALLAGSPDVMALLERRIAELLGSLTMARRTIAKLKDQGVLV